MRIRAPTKYFPEQIAQYQGFIKGLEADMKTLAEHPHPMVVKEKPVPVHSLPQIGIKSSFCDVTKHMNFFIAVALTLNDPMLHMLENAIPLEPETPFTIPAESR